jgi:hypothetical protein
MIRECFLVNTGIQFYYDSFKDIGLDPNTLFPFVTPRPAALKPSAATLAEIRASAHSAEPTDAITDEAQAAPIAASTFKTEEDEELVDALCPIYDQLKLAKAWWILEILPLRHRAQNRKGFCWKPYWQYVLSLYLLHVTHAGMVVLPRINLGHARRIPRPVRERKEKIRVHRSVKTRMEAEGPEGRKYVPNAKFEHLDFEWVD